MTDGLDFTAGRAMFPQQALASRAYQQVGILFSTTLMTRHRQSIRLIVRPVELALNQAEKKYEKYQD